jgi:hypothetical protein
VNARFVIGMCLLAARVAHAQPFAPQSVVPSWPAAAQQPPPSGLAPPGQAAAPQAEIHPAVARIVAPGQGSVSYGSGTLVFVAQETGLVITNWHVINEASGPISVHFPDGFYSPGNVVRVDRDWDLALIAIRKPPVAPVPLASAAPHPGDVLTIAGYGAGTYRAASGYCTQYVAPGTTFPFEMVEVAVSARQGDSGGPIFNRQGELAGVLFGEGNGRTSGSYCGRVRWFLSSVVSEETILGAQLAARGVPPPALRPSAPPTPERFEPELPMVALSPPRATPMNHGPAAATALHPGIAPLASVSTTSTMHPTAAVAPPVQSLSWEDLAGYSLGEQLKTVLAIVGVLGGLFHLLRWLSGEPAKE